jgi:hypothetical protein
VVLLLGAIVGAALAVWLVQNRRIPTLRVSCALGKGHEEVSLDWLELKYPALDALTQHVPGEGQLSSRTANLERDVTTVWAMAEDFNGYVLGDHMY